MQCSIMGCLVENEMKKIRKDAELVSFRITSSVVHNELPPFIIKVVFSVKFCYVLQRVEPLLRNDCEVRKYTRAVSRQTAR
jgi:hypothetical protein